MNFDFLPNDLKTGLTFLDIKKLFEIRLRTGYGVVINYDFKKVYLSTSGATLFRDNAIICTDEHIEKIINAVTEYSIYAHNEKIKQGYLTANDGIRIGLAGECVYEKNQIVTVKNVSSLNIRIPNDIDGCCMEIYKCLINDGKIYNSLIVSPPFCGKTTILKDLVKKLDKSNNFSILVMDERGEFENIRGANIDKIRFSDKLYGLNCGVRTLSPNVIIMDELSGKSDWKGVLSASNSGVKIVATCHGEDMRDILSKNYFIKNIFERYFFLTRDGGMGKLKKIYNKEFELLQ